MELRKILRIIHFFSWASLFLWSCSTKDEIKPDEKPIQIKAIGVGNATAEQVTLNAEVLYVNDESVVDFGFVVKEGATGINKKISLGKSLQAGIISYNYVPEKLFKIGATFSYHFYLVTSVKTYETDEIPFAIADFKVDQRGLQMVTLGDTLILTGEFKQLENAIFKIKKLGVYSSPRLIQPLKISTSEIRFKIPEEIGFHQEMIGIFVYKDEDNTIGPYSEDLNLVNFKLRARTVFGFDGPIYLTDNLPISLIGFRQYNDTPPRIIVGDQVVEYNDWALRSAFNKLKGTTHRLGVIWDQDTLMSPKVLQFRSPQSKDFTLDKVIAHQSSKVGANLPNFLKFFQGVEPEIFIGDKKSKFFGSNMDQFWFQLPDVAEGTYTPRIEHPVYGSVPLGRQIEVVKLRAAIQNKKKFLVGEEIVIKGNFIDGETYVFRAASEGDMEIFSGTATDGIIRFALPQMRVGTQKLRTVVEEWDPTMETGVLEEFEYDGMTIYSVSPLKGASGDILTIKGRGMTQFGYELMLGDYIMQVISRTATEVKVFIPQTLRKGKFPFRYHDNFNQKYISTDFEIEVY